MPASGKIGHDDRSSLLLADGHGYTTALHIGRITQASFSHYVVWGGVSVVPASCIGAEIDSREGARANNR